MSELYKDYDPETLKKLQRIELEILNDFNNFCKKHEIHYFGVGGTAIGAVRHKGFIPWDDDIDIGFLREDYEKFLELAQKELTDKYKILNTETDHNYPLMTTRLVLKDTIFREECFKDLNCDLGIFLDLYCFDKIYDDDQKMKKEAFKAWFWGKMMILCSIGKPVLYFGGWKARIVKIGCQIINKIFKLFKISPYFFYKKAKKVIIKHNGESTKRVAYFFDPTPFTSIMEIDDILPIQELVYNELMISFPAKVERYLEKRYGNYMELPPEEKRHNHPPYKLDFGKY